MLRLLEGDLGPKDPNDNRDQIGDNNFRKDPGLTA